MKNIIKTSYYIVIVCFVLFWVAIAIPGIKTENNFYQKFIVQSDSMKPTFSKGDLVIVNKQLEYKQNDIITFKLKDNPNNNSITHRIFKTVNRDGKTMFITKGDANSIVDSQLIDREEIIGKVVRIIPYLGMFIYVAQNKLGSIFYVTIPIILIFIIEIKKIIVAIKSGK